MVKVVNEAKWTCEVVCDGKSKSSSDKGCGSTLQVERDDCRYFSAREGYMRDYDAQVVIKCPICKLTTDLPKAKWPWSAETLKPWSTAWATNTTMVEDD